MAYQVGKTVRTLKPAAATTRAVHRAPDARGARGGTTAAPARDLPGCITFPRAWSVIEPGIVPAVRTILAAGGHPAMSCAGHGRGYSWWPEGMLNFATRGRPWVLVGSRTLPDLYGVVGGLLLDRRGPLALYPVRFRGESAAFMRQLRNAAPRARIWSLIVFSSRTAVLPLEDQVRRAANARPGGRPLAAEAPRAPRARPQGRVARAVDGR